MTDKNTQRIGVAAGKLNLPDNFDEEFDCQELIENMFLLTNDATITNYTSENIIKA